MFVNIGGELRQAWIDPTGDYTRSVAWGDWDRDGDLDLATGSWHYPNVRPIRVLTNMNSGLRLAWSSPETSNASSIAWDDMDSDGDLDLVAGNYNSPLRAYANVDGALELAWSSATTDLTESVAWGDWDNDGDPDLAVGNGGNYPGRADGVYINHLGDNVRLGGAVPRAKITYPAGAAGRYFASAIVLTGPIIPVVFTLFDEGSDPVRFVKAYYSLNGGSTWQPAVAASGTITRNLAASPEGIEHTFIWDVYASNVFGSSDSTVFRLDVYQGFTGPGHTNTLSVLHIPCPSGCAGARCG